MEKLNYSHSYKYDTLINVFENNKTKIDNIKNEYINLLSFLTSAPNISNEEFINKIHEISKIGEIIICYYEEKEKFIIVGSGTVIFEPKIIHSCKNVGHIEDIVVHKDYRGLKIAQNILNTLVEISYKKDCYKVILDCKKDLTIFYEKNGFINNGIQMSKYFT